MRHSGGKELGYTDGRYIQSCSYGKNAGQKRETALVRFSLKMSRIQSQVLELGDSH